MTGATAFSEVSLRTLQLHALAAAPQVSPSSGKEGQVLRLLSCTVGRSGFRLKQSVASAYSGHLIPLDLNSQLCAVVEEGSFRC